MFTIGTGRRNSWSPLSRQAMPGTLYMLCSHQEQNCVGAG